MAIGTPVGSAFLEVQPQLGAGFQAAIASKINPIMAGAAGIAGGVLAGGLAAGFAAFKIGETFDSAFDEIRVKTGATGDEFARLQEDFKGVFASVPTDAGLAGQAISELNQRLGLTGQPLQALATQFLELSRITETDLGANIEAGTRVFGDWGVAAAEQAAHLDTLFRAAQQTGVGVDQLSATMVQFGAPLRQLGFSFDQAAALIGQFEKEGVNTELVMGGMRVALGKMARAGEEPIETFSRIVESIENAGSVGERNTLALEAFGQRAGPDMAAAIAEGKFSIDELYASIANGSDTIVGAGSETQDFAEKWNLFKNRVLVALEPIATRVFEGIGKLVDALAPKISSFITGTLVPAVEGFAAWWDANGPRIMEVAGALFNGLTLGFQAIAGVIGSVVNAFKSNETKISGTVTKIGNILSGLGDVIRVIFEAITAFWKEWGPEITALVGNAFETIGGIIEGIVTVIEGVVNVIAGIFTGDWKRIWEGLSGIVGGVWETIKSIIQGAVNQVLIFFGDFIRKAQTNIRTGLDKVIGFFRELPGKILGFLGALPGKMVQFGADLVAGILEGLGNLGSKVFDSIKGAVTGAIDRVKDFFGNNSPSTYMIKHVGIPFGQGVTVGYERGLDPAAMLATTRRAMEAIDIVTAARSSSIFIPKADGGAQATSAGGPAIGNVNFYDTREKPAEESLQEAGLKVAVMLNLRK